MGEVTVLDIATVSAVVAALVTVIGNTFRIDKRYRALLAIGIAAILWFIPKEWANQIVMALIIGLTASGVYSQVKPRDNDDDELLRYEMKEKLEKERNEKNDALLMEEDESVSMQYMIVDIDTDIRYDNFRTELLSRVGGGTGPMKPSNQHFSLERGKMRKV